ncbi:MAG TPA: GIY-YIG nuclease family protein [Bacteroidales bacterium]|nr:GIY-YIG nuclease family protein [Bacteroidales bacterium]
MTTLYVLIDNDQVRYIGKTETQNLSQKLNEHIEEAKSNPDKFGWILEMGREGKKPELIPIFTYSDQNDEYYEKLFISNYKFLLKLKLNRLMQKPMLAN